MALNWPTFLTRTGSAIVFAIIMMAGLLWNEWAFLLLIAVIQLLALREYFRLVKKINPDVYWPAWLPVVTQLASTIALFVMSPAFLWLCDTMNMPPLNGFLFFKTLLFLPVFIMLLATLPKQTGWLAALQSFGGILYITLPVVMLMQMRMQSLVLPLSLVLMIWTNDTMAYIVGSLIGKTPFSEISPKKTWEGTAGGALLTIIGAGIWGYFTSYYSMRDWMVLALCAAVAGTLGDLLESKLKRMAGVKDSGAIMPGHGGALDRFDSLLVATPFAFTYAYIFMAELPLVIF